MNNGNKTQVYNYCNIKNILKIFQNDQIKSFIIISIYYLISLYFKACIAYYTKLIKVSLVSF